MGRFTDLKDVKPESEQRKERRKALWEQHGQKCEELLRELDQDFFEGNGLVYVRYPYRSSESYAVIEPPKGIDHLHRLHRIRLSLGPTIAGDSFEVRGRNIRSPASEGDIRQAVAHPDDFVNAVTTVVTTLLTDDCDD